MQETKFQEAIFSLWAFKFIYTFEQLLEDGYNETEVLDYFSSNLKDVSFVWRLSYAGHMREIHNKKKPKNILKEVVNICSNLWTFLSMLLLSKIGITNFFSTRRMCPCDFFPVLTKTPKTIRIRADCSMSLRVYPFTKRTDFWKKKFISFLDTKKYKVSASTKKLIEQNLDQLFPTVFNIKGRTLPKQFSKMKMFNFASDILKSNVLFNLLWCHYSGEISGVQHGGGYAIVKSRNFKAEIQCYEMFYLHKLEQNHHAKIPKSRLKLIGNPGVILVASMPIDIVEAFRGTKDTKKVVNNRLNRDYLRKALRNTETPTYIREHPKANTSSYNNTEYFEPKSSKPVIWARSTDLIILEAPGTTTEINCIKYGLPYICAFDLLDFDLTKVGIAHYHSLQSRGCLISVNDVKSVIKQKFNAQTQN
jgi:hypothetical protein